MKSIPLTQNKTALVDDADFDMLSEFTWCASKVAATFYALTSIGTNRDNHRPFYMHRILTRPAQGLDVHHLDGNGLNNQRANLRVLTRAEHIYFNPPRSSTGYKGVVYCVHKRPGIKPYSFYLAQMIYRGARVLHSGHPTAEEAARAYDAKVLELIGPQAYLNFPAEAAKQRERAGAQNGDEP